MRSIPEHIVDCLADTFADRLDGHHVVKRNIRATDPAKSVGIKLVNWAHTLESAQIGQVEPVLGRYVVSVQNMIKMTDEELALKAHNIQNALIRGILYRDSDLRVRLIGTTEEVQGSYERVKRMGVTRQDFLSNQISGNFLHLCATELWVETEITQI